MPTLNLGQVRPVYRGVWNSVDNYKAYDFVIYNGSAYLALKEVPSNYEPPSQVGYWVLFGAKGDPGEPGSDGVDGSQGERGPSPGYRWNGTFLSIQNPDGTWPDQGIDLQGPAVPLSNSVISTSETDAASSKAVKTAYDKASEAFAVAGDALPKSGGAISGELTVKGYPVALATLNTLFNRNLIPGSPAIVLGGTLNDVNNYALYDPAQMTVGNANKAARLQHNGDFTSPISCGFRWDAAVDTSMLAAFNADGSLLHPVEMSKISVSYADKSGAISNVIPITMDTVIPPGGTWLVMEQSEAGWLGGSFQAGGITVGSAFLGGFAIRVS